MAKNRFFKATNGTITVFRASATRTYAAGCQSRLGVQFAAAMMPGYWPAEEITQGEYAALQAAKVERVKSAGGDPAQHSAPYCSWVSNASLAPQERA